MKEKKRIPTDGPAPAWPSPFAALKDLNLATTSDSKPLNEGTDIPPAARKKNRGRVDIVRQTAHRGGKTVTVVTRFVDIHKTEIERLAKQMQKACGAGGTVKEGRIEIQGDHRDSIAHILTEAGFRPVFAGG